MNTIIQPSRRGHSSSNEHGACLGNEAYREVPDVELDIVLIGLEVGDLNQISNSRTLSIDLDRAMKRRIQQWVLHRHTVTGLNWALWGLGVHTRPIEEDGGTEAFPDEF